MWVASKCCLYVHAHTYATIYVCVCICIIWQICLFTTILIFFALLHSERVKGTKNSTRYKWPHTSVCVCVCAYAWVWVWMRVCSGFCACARASLLLLLLLLEREGVAAAVAVAVAAIAAWPFDKLRRFAEAAHHRAMIMMFSCCRCQSHNVYLFFENKNIHIKYVYACI